VDQSSDDTALFLPLLCYSSLPNTGEGLIGSLSSHDSSVLKKAVKAARGCSVRSEAFQ
jgi:hypothetical protein